MPHSHAPYAADDPRTAAWPDCPYRTKKECGAAISAWKKEIRDHDAVLKAEKAARQKAERDIAYQEYVLLENERIAAILRGQ